MKFLLVPFMIIGMFVSFAAALIAMLFLTETVTTEEQLRALFLGAPDTLEVVEEFRRSEDRLQIMFELAEDYRALQEQTYQEAERLRDSLAAQRTQLKALEDSLLQEQQRLGMISESRRREVQEHNLEILATFYENLRAPRAAEILQQESQLSETAVAALMTKLSPRQMARIMGEMNPDFAARITRIMKEQQP